VIVSVGVLDEEIEVFDNLEVYECSEQCKVEVYALEPCRGAAPPAGGHGRADGQGG
jgi:hypothetical protein